MSQYNVHILRHSDYDKSSWLLSNFWKEQSYQKWQLLQVRVSNDIQIITSSSPRAVQTWEYIAEWLGLTSEELIIKSTHLQEEGNISLSIKDIIENVKSQTIIITHKPRISEISRFLWYTWEINNNFSYLEWNNFLTTDDILDFQLFLLKEIWTKNLSYSGFEIDILTLIFNWTNTVIKILNHLNPNNNDFNKNSIEYAIKKLLRLGFIIELEYGAFWISTNTQKKEKKICPLYD